MARDETEGVDRRGFLRRSGKLAIGAAGLGLADVGQARTPAAKPSGVAATATPSIKRYVKLGSTDLTIPDICAGGLANPNIVRYCYDRGMTYFDTAQMFGGEPFVAKGLKGVRDKVSIATKYKMQPGDDRHKIMRKLEKSLRSLKTDYVDVFFNHAVNDIARAKNPEWPEFIELAKKQGKIRYAGMSGHGGNLHECLDYVLDNDIVDVILASHNFGIDPAFYERFTKHFDFIANQKGLPRLLKKAHDKGVGVLVMKTLMGAKVNDLSRYEVGEAAFHRAAFRWVLADPNIDALLISMKNRDLADKYLACSGDEVFQKADFEVLDRYVQNETSDYCRPACNTCESSCPHGVPIADVLRQRMYVDSYQDFALGHQGYETLGPAANPCLTCEDTPCLNTCPYGLEIPELTRDTARRLRRG